MSKDSIAAGLEQIAQNEINVYIAGYGNGYNAGKAEGGNAEEAYNAGKQDMNVTMMDAITCNGTRTNYNSAFWGEKWTDELFKPHVVIKPTNFNSGFYGSKIENSAYTDLLDFSNCTTLSAAFYMSSVKKLKVIDARNTTGVGMGNIFAMCSKLESIDEFYPSSVSSNKPSFSSTFVGCSALTKIIFKSEISQNGLNLQYATKLSRESIESIINNLSNTTSGLSITLSKTAVDKACAEMELSDSYNSTNSAWWAWLTGRKSNWTISLL